MSEAEAAAAACDPQNFTRVTQQVWDCLVKKAWDDYGIRITGPRDCASKLGVKICWNWNSGAATLMIQCTEKPFIITCGTVHSTVKGAVNGCGGSGG
jgi:hypothetical protein